MNTNKFFQSNFIKNGFVVLIGTVTSSCITFLSIPYITRFYRPGTYGSFSIFFSLINTLSVVSVLRLDIGLMRGSLKNSLNTVTVSKFVLLCFTSLVLVISSVLVLLETISVFYLFSAPIIYFTGSSLLMSSWFNKRKNYQLISLNNIIKTLSKSVLDISLGFFGILSHGLYISLLLSSMLSYAYYRRKFRETLIKISKSLLFKVYRDNKNIVFFNVPNVLVDSLRGFSFF